MKKLTLLMAVCIFVNCIFYADAFADQLKRYDEAGKRNTEAENALFNWKSAASKLREEIKQKGQQINKLKGKMGSKEQIEKEQELKEQRQKEYEEAMAIVAKGKDKPEDLVSWVFFGGRKNRFNCAVLFAAGEAFLLKNNRREARRAYEQIVRDFPKSRYAVIVHKRLKTTMDNTFQINIVYPPAIVEEDSMEVVDTAQKVFSEKPLTTWEGQINSLDEKTADMLQEIEYIKSEVEFLKIELQKKNEELEVLKKEVGGLVKQEGSDGEIRLKNGTVIKGKVIRSEGPILIILREDGTEWPVKRISVESINGMPVENLPGFNGLGEE